MPNLVDLPFLSDPLAESTRVAKRKKKEDKGKE